MTWANLLTVLRLTLIPSLGLAIGHGDWSIAAWVFCIAIITDIYDGKLARRLNQASPLGGLLDHLTDATFVTVGCWALAQHGLLTSGLSYLIPLAFLQYMLDSRALAGQVLRTSQLGRMNGIAYFVVVGIAIGMQVLDWHFLGAVVTTLAWALVATTLASVADRALTLIRTRRAA